MLTNQESLNVSRNRTYLESSRLGNTTERTESIRHRFSEIQLMIDDLQKSKLLFERTALPPEEKDISSRVDRTYQVLRNDLTQVRNEIDDLKMELEGDQDYFDNKEKEFLQTNIAIFYVTLKDRLNQAQKCYSEFKESAKAKLCRQVKNIDTDNAYSEEKIGQMVEENPDVVANLIQKRVLGVASIELQGAAQDVFDKCESIKKLQKSIKELVQMLKEISEIVSIQGERVDTIAEHVSNAKNHVARAEKHVVQAKEYHSSARCVRLLAADHHRHNLPGDLSDSVGNNFFHICLTRGISNSKRMYC